MRPNEPIGRWLVGTPRFWANGLFLCLLMLWGLTAQAVPPPTGLAPVVAPPGGFAIDGDLLANKPEAGAGDWLLGPSGTGGAVLGANGAPLNPAITFHFVDPYNTTDDETFGGGLKWTDNPNVWTWTKSKPSGKTDINNVLLHVTTDADGHTWLIVAADRLSTSGDSYIDFEFLQSPLTRNGNGTFVSAGPNGGRTTNDMVLCLAFTDGGSRADFFAHRWVRSGSGFAYVDATAALPAGRVFVSANPTNVAVPFGAFGQTNYAANAYAEAAIDLTAMLGGFDPCLSIGIKTIMVKTKTSTSSSASIVDFLNPIQYTMKLGPSADAGPDQARCTEGDSTLFTLQGKATAGLYPLISTNWSVVSGTVTLDSMSTLATTARVFSPTATLRLTVIQANGCIETDEVVLTVNALPVASITGPTLVCPQSSTQFQGPAGMAGYAWSVTGNGSISGAANARTVAVVAGSGCGTNFTLSLVVTSNSCPGAASTEVVVNDTTPPMLTLPADKVLDCPAAFGTNLTGVATALDDCGKATVSFSDSITNGCGGTKVIARTWIASDSCGNTTSGVQTITVRDITPPTLIVPTNVVQECPGDPSTIRNGMATATDTCGTVTVTYSDSISNGCGGAKVIARLWTATDACGNATNRLQTITIRDTLPPALTVPANAMLECPGDIGTAKNGTATALDACGAVTITYSDSISNGCGGTKVISRLWTATDECGNATNRLQTITVRDTTPPALTMPANAVLECPGDISTAKNGTATALDACGAVTVTYSDSISNGCGGTKIVSRLWTATDACGNRTNALQTIAVRDTTPPALTVPANAVLECPGDISTAKNGTATGVDACGAVTVTYSDSISNGCGGTKIVSRLWTATDVCGNATNGLQIITVRDTTPPALTVPVNAVLECPGDISTNKNGTAMGFDACGAVAITYRDSISNSCGGTKIITRLWTATDACGNATNGLQVITVRDTTPPALTVPANAVLECPGDLSTTKNGMATGVDACGSVTITYSDSISNGCGGTKIVSRLWTATDQCGNATNRLQTLTVVDRTPPALKLPANRVLDCPGDTRTNVTGVATAPDACGSVAIMYSDTVSNSCGSTKMVWRLWTATDQCGNTTNGLQTIVVQDITKPTITCRAINVQCTGDVPPAYTNLTAFLAAGNTASDACDTALTFALVSASGLTGSCPAKITRVYRVTDDCGNFADGTQTIMVDDTITPVVACPTNRTVECGASLEPATLGQATATDNCSTNVILTYSDAVVGSQYNINFYAADSDVNTGPYAPTYLKLGPASLPCPTEARLTGRAVDPLRNAVAYGPTAGQLDALTSLGGEPMRFGQVVPFEVVIEVGGGPGPERGTIEFTADWSTHTTSNDDFGFDKNYMIYCAFVDAADPGLVDPHYNARVESVASRLVNTGTIEEQIEGTFRVSGLNSGDRVVVEVWLVLDAAAQGHASGTIAAQLMSAAKATVPPEPISVGSKTISIGNLSKIEPLPAPQPQPPPPPLPPQPPVPPGYIVSVIDRTWAATDDCGNRGTCVQRITVRDTTPPLLSAPADRVLECPAEVTTNSTGTAIAPDTCGTVTLSYSDVVSNSCAGTKTLWRTWTATDGYNSTNSVQTIVVSDTTPPAISVPANTVLEFPGDISTNLNGVATALDSCGKVTVTYSDSSTNGCGATKIVSRLWTATDECGNTTNALQTITIGDTTAPNLVCPTNLVLECPADTTTNATGVATATDACGLVAILYSDVVSNGTGGTKIIARTWTAIDPCGNSTSAVQTITVSDTAPPKVTVALVNTISSDGYGAGNQALLPEKPNFTTVFPKGLMIGRSATNSVMGGHGRLLWEPNTAGWTALATVLTAGEEASGPLTQNAINPTETYGGGELAVQTITLTLNIGYNGAGVIGAGPNNFGSLIYSHVGDSLSGKTVSQILAAANGALGGDGLPAGHEFSSLAALIENLNLSFFNYTASAWATAHLSEPMVVVQCASEVPAPDAAHVTATDSCSSPVSITPLPDQITEYVNANQYTIIRTWVAADACGNTNTASFRIIVHDTTPPVLTRAPDFTVMANIAWDFDEPIAADNCSRATVSVLSTVTNVTSDVAGEDRRLITRTWQAADGAGNTSICQQTATVVTPPPQDPPVIVTSPQCQIVGSGNDTTLSVSATGLGPLTYQWQLNGVNIPGATGSSFALTGLQFENAGLYRVIVSNGGGAVTSQAAVVDVLPRLVIKSSGNILKLTWPSGFLLQAADSPVGPYTDVAGAASPYIYDMATNPLKFFRLRSQPFALTTTPLPDGKMSVSGTGVPGCNFIIQASTDLIHWVNLATNASPIAFVDSEAGQYPVRFYRAIAALASAAPVPVAPPIISVQPAGQTADSGADATLAVTATGAGPFSYQWRRNGSAIPGATGSALTLSDLEFADAGLYSVEVRNAGGAVTSSATVINVAPQLDTQTTGQGLTLTWPEPFILQAAPNAAGPYTDVAGATSPYLYDTLANPPKFFRLRLPSFSLTMVPAPGGALSITGSGVPGYNFTLQGSTDLKNWVDLGTSPSPCAFVDTEAAQYPQRFYRAVLAH